MAPGDTDRFWSKVQKTDSCWVWFGARDTRGYGNVNVGGRTLKAHRYAWELEHGRSPGDACVLHQCDNTSCVNPAHLTLGTQAQNVLEARQRGRWGAAKLTAENVHAIRGLAAQGASDVALAQVFGVHHYTISRIRRGTEWKHALAEGMR